MRAYDLIETGFMIKLDLKLFDREAVMKALYRFHDKYIISYETKKSFVYVYFETSDKIYSVEAEVADIMKELSFQMIRLDTARRTRGLRELLVARALYATCIEPERTTIETDPEAKKTSWKEDQDRIFLSWSAE